MNKQKSLMGDDFQEYMFGLVTDSYGLCEKSSKGSKSHFSGLIDWPEKPTG